MDIYRVYDGGEFWDWAASDADRAKELHLDFNYAEAGIPLEDADPDMRIIRIPDDKVITVTEDGGDGPAESKTAREWADGCGGEGCIGTSCV